MQIVARYASHSLPVSDFENELWQACQPVLIDHYWSGEPAPPSRHAEARICWSNEAIHVRFVCRQQEPLVVAVNPKTDTKTLGLWDRDVCEIFLAPDAANPSRYYEFEAAPNGEWVDLGITMTPAGRETDWDYASGFTTAASLAGEELTIGMRIPWSESIPKPQGGEIWLANLFRCVGPESPDRYLAWRPTRTPEPNFHVPEAFGQLRFEP
jgi:alpha-galactosidase